MHENGREGNQQKQERLDPRKVRFIELLVAGNSIAEAGRQLKLAERTSYRWSADQTVQNEVRRLEADRLDQAVRLLSRLAAKAVATLGRNMGTDVAPSVQVRAATAAIDALLRLRETVLLEARIQALEDQARVQQPNYYTT